MTYIPKPLSVGTLFTQLWAEVPSALDLDPLKLPEDATDFLFGEEWDPEEEELTFDFVPLFRRGFDDFSWVDQEDLPRDRRTNGFLDPLPMLDLSELGERGVGEYGEVWRVPEVKELGGSPEGGTDRLAWYTPFHIDPHRWGIYIREKGLHYLAQQVFEPEGLSYPEALERAMQLLYDHEIFHFLTEMAATGWELISRQPHYVPYAAAHRMGRKIFNPLEEALAEANAFWPYRHHQCRLFPLKGAVESHLKAGPAGYRDFDNYTSYATRSWGLQELSGQIWPGRTGTYQHFGELGFDFDNRVVNRAQVPVRLVRLRRWRGAWAEFAKFLPATQVDESAGFQKELKKAGSVIQKKWKDKLRQLMTEAINASGLYFKAIPRCPGRFFLRVEDNYRAVLEPIRDGHYIATRVLDHRAYERLLKEGC